MRNFQCVAPKKIYLAVPYSHPDSAVRHERYEKITALAAELMGQGHLVFSTITYTHHMAQVHTLPTNYEWWHTLNTSFIEWADTLLVLRLDGWKESRGVTAEIKEAKRLGKEIAYV